MDDIRATLQSVLEYEPESGVFRWRIQSNKRRGIGDIAGSFNKDGYVQIGFRRKYYLAHRLAWLFMTGDWPTQMLDHANLIKCDNRWANLREATPSENMVNQKRRRSLPKGVRGYPSGRYTARIRYKRRTLNLGLFDTLEEASSAYKRAARAIYGEFARD